MKIDSKKNLKEFLAADFSRYPKQRLPYFIRWIIKDEQTRILHYIWVLRHTEYFINKESPFAYFWIAWQKRLSNILNIHINPNCCGKGLRLVHLGGGIYLNANRIGDNFTATTGVVIGKKGTNEERPFIGNNVNFTIGSKAYGGITIGNNVTIAPNSVVIKSIDDNIVVSGVPAKIIKNISNENK